MTMDIHEILNTLPHRFPILLVDRVLEIEVGVRIKALKNISINEPYFSGHFPFRPVMPGVLMIEALAQTAAILGYKSFGEAGDNSVFYFAGIDDAQAAAGTSANVKEPSALLHALKASINKYFEFFFDLCNGQWHELILRVDPF